MMRARAIRLAVMGLLAGSMGAAVAAPAAAASPGSAAGVAKIASIQGQVETRKTGETAWTASTLYQVLEGLDRVRTGPASRAVIVYSDRTVQKLAEKSEVEIQPPSGSQPGALKVTAGASYFSSRSPKDYGRIETPTVTAAIKGTEFVVEVAEDTTTTITMLEGVVEASNSMGAVTIGSGEQALAEPGKAPVKKIVVRPRDAVTWALYFPPVLSETDARRLESMGGTGQDLAKAAGMLAAGQVREASALIEAARRTAPTDPVALALASVVETAENQDDEALRLARQAVANGPDSAAAALALSYAYQARFDIAGAREMAEKAASLDPTGSLALARAAELRMAEGDIGGAMKSAQEAVARTPNDARALAVQGFVALAEYRSKEALALFEKAVAADSSSPLARLGLGIARIRRNQLAEGREELQTATALDPDDSLLRSYLGKALYEEKIDKDAGKEYAEAKQLDPNDPTPWLYDAILLQNENRPAEALENMQKSIALNDNRAVYRSRFLLDQDRAVRSADLALVYNDLGFEQLGLVTARRAADENQASYSAHNFLASNYRNLPDYAPAFFSEVLQGRIYQPVSVNAARPDAVNESVSFNEYTALFDRPRLRGFGSLAYGRTDTNIDSVVMNPALLEFLSLDSSHLEEGQVIGTLNGDRYAAALSWRGYDNDGFRFNNQQRIDNYRGFFQFAPGYSDTFQLNFIGGANKSGDLPLGFTPYFPSNFVEYDSRLWNAGAGYHHIFSPATELVASVIFSTTRQTAQPFFCNFQGSFVCDKSFPPFDTTAVLRGPQAELQQVLRLRWTTWVFGAGGFNGTTSVQATGQSTIESDDEFANAYAYFTMRPAAVVDITLGASEEHVVSPTGIFLPRDAGENPADIDFTRSKLSPKFGLTVRPGEGTTLRAAAFWRLSPAIGRIQTLEPTQVAGFNQFYNDPGGTSSFTYGAAIDQTFGRKLYGGVSILRRELYVPQGTCDAPTQFGWCRGRTVTHIEEESGQNTIGALYFNAVLTKRLTFALEGTYDDRTFDWIQYNNDTLYEDHAETWTARPLVRYFLPCGFFAGASATYYHQEVDQFDDFNSDQRFVDSEHFWLGDIVVGYRFPKRYGSVVLQAGNVSDREFPWFDRRVEETFIPARTILLKVNLSN